MLKIQRVKDDEFQVWLTEPLCLLGRWNRRQVDDAAAYIAVAAESSVGDAAWFTPRFQKYGEPFYLSNGEKIEDGNIGA